MPPKKKHGEGGTKRRFKSESSSSDSEDSTFESTRILAMEIAQPRTTRQSARTCMRKNRDDSLMEQEMKARGEPKPKLINFDYMELLANPAYDHPELYKAMEPEDFNMDYYYQTGLNEVLKFSCPPEKLGMKMVDGAFEVNDVEKLVGGNRIITVVVVATQQSEDMPLKEFVKYFNDVRRATPDTLKNEKKTLYNVLSLEFSNTALTDLVQSPALVREIDWASSWPDERKMRMISFENDGTFRVQNLYPRVENYCLMSPTECYTDFHVDFHGTSVWYHVKKGKKVFWIIEPTEQNLKMYEEYLKNTETSAFFGDIVEKCARVEVWPGNTLIIPSGWIHAVYTPVDSLVFGGNFLHSRSALMQLNVLQGENRIGINKKYRYPYSEEAVFFYLNRVVKEVTGRDYIRPMTRNQQMKYAEYVGELFREKMLHHKVPTKEDYDDDGCVWKNVWDESREYMESKAKLAKWDSKKEEDENDGDEGRMEMKKDYDDDMPVLSPKKEVADEVREKEKEAGDGQPMFGGHDDLFVDEHTFYHPVSFNLDAGRGATAVHTLPLSSAEPTMHINKVALKKMLHPMEVPQWEGLIVTYLKKSKVDLPEGLTRPNSLIQAFCRLLRERRRLAKVEDGIDLPPSVLPDSEGSRRLHEEQKRAAAERKRKYEEKKMKIEEGDGEEDTDWTEETEQPKKKKTRKSTEEVGKMVDSDAKVKKEIDEENERKNNLNDRIIKFVAWYMNPAQQLMRDDLVLAKVWYSLRKRGMAEISRNDFVGAWNQGTKEQKNQLFEKYCLKELRDLLPPSIPKPSIMRAAEVGSQFSIQPIQTKQAEVIKRQLWNQIYLQSEPRNTMPSSSHLGEVRVITADQSALQPLHQRRITGAATDGWAGMSGGKRRSDGERRDRTPGGRSPTRKPSSSHFSPADIPPPPSHPLTPTTPSTPAPSGTVSSSKQTRLSQAEQFAMAAPKVIDAPRLATPLQPTQNSNSELSVVSTSSSNSGDHPLPMDVWCAQMERFTAEIERANAIMGSTSTNGN